MITTVTLNASVDKAYYLDCELKSGTVMRVSRCINTAGGKGLNVARVIKLLGEEVMATGLLGGNNGAYLEELLEKDGLENKFVHIDSETRCCVNVLDRTAGSTEFLEPGAEVGKYDVSVFLLRFQELAEKSEVITLSGSIPKGVEANVYARMIEIAHRYGKKVILDTSGACLQEGIKAKPTMIKPNEEELEILLGRKIQSREQAVEAAKQLQKTGIPLVVVSMGAEGALLVCQEGVYQGKPPVLKAVNTVGCGDSMVAAFAAAMRKNLSMKESLKYAVAVSAANAMSPQTGNFETRTMEEIMKNVEIITHEINAEVSESEETICH